MQKQSFSALLKQVRSCQVCEIHLPLGPRPVLQAHENSKILIIGQAPGIRVHRSGIPWHDASGERLRDWLGVASELFYDEKVVAIMPMGFCYPGTGDQGDLPPRRECFDLWHKTLKDRMPEVGLTILIGSYAQKAYLKKGRKKTLTETVKSWEECLPHYLPLPHPSPLNNIWLRKNRWFQETELPKIRKLVRSKL